MIALSSEDFTILPSELRDLHHFLALHRVGSYSTMTKWHEAKKCHLDWRISTFTSASRVMLLVVSFVHGRLS